MRGVFTRTSPLAIVQLALALAAMLLVAFTPPAQGRMLLVPLDGTPIATATIQQSHATPLKPGPLQGSWVVDGRRASLAGLFSSEGIIVLAAPEAICGGAASNEAKPS